MAFFLAKTDPESYPVARLRSDRRTVWDGVRNPQALRAIREMKPGDRVFVYHSGSNPAVMGVAKVASDPRPDPRDPKLTVVDFEFAGLLSPPVTLREIRDSGLFQNMALLRQPRLSTMAVTENFADWLLGRSRVVS